MAKLLGSLKRALTQNASAMRKTASNAVKNIKDGLRLTNNVKPKLSQGLSIADTSPRIAAKQAATTAAKRSTALVPVKQQGRQRKGPFNAGGDRLRDGLTNVSSRAGYAAKTKAKRANQVAERKMIATRKAVVPFKPVSNTNKQKRLAA